MRLLRQGTALLLLALAWLVSGCGRNDDVALVPETEDSNYQLGKQLQRHGRDGEALNAFLKVIETRGSRAAPQSHLEAGSIYLHHSKNPIEAIHHFNKYLDLRPNSPEAPLVKDLIKTATREFALRLPSRPFDDQSVRLAENKEIEKLRRENEELRAELATLRGGGAVPVPRASGPALKAEVPRERTPAPADSPVSAAPAKKPGPVTLREVRPAPTTTAPEQPASRATQNRPPPTKGRTHTVAARENLWSIARKYYGEPPSAARVQALFDANRDVMSSPTDLKIGMTLRIP